MKGKKHITWPFLVGIPIAVLLMYFYPNPNDWLHNAISVSESQLSMASGKYSPNATPRSIKEDGTVRLAQGEDWTTGFFPGSLWYMYEITGNNFFKTKAKNFSSPLDTLQYCTTTHDLGFMLYCSLGNGLRLTQDLSYEKILLKGASSLASRFHPKVGSIRSWEFGEWQYPVIIDNMMNLEYLMWASKATENKSFKEIALTHANTTLKNHFRNDYSSYHVLDYDTITGIPVKKQTFQGYSNESAWARGQAWGLYGFTMMYRFTKDKRYLNQAKAIAHFILKHPHLPNDKIPYWDFNAPDIPNAPRDASAAAVMANAFMELSCYTSNGANYFNAGETILKTLSSPKYLAKPGTNAFFILKHSVGSIPHNLEVDVPINYADYYFLEALIRYARIKDINLTHCITSEDKS